MRPTKEQMIVTVALALYDYNVSPVKRAEAIYMYFVGDCMEPEDLVNHFANKEVITQLPMPTVKAHIMLAMQKYGDEARARVEANLEEYR